MSTLTTYYQWEDETVRERTGHPPSDVVAKKMKSLTLHTHGCLKASLRHWSSLLLMYKFPEWVNSGLIRRPFSSVCHSVTQCYGYSFWRSVAALSHLLNHSGYLYSASSSTLLLRGAPDYSIDTVSELTRRSATGNCEWRSCPRCGGWSEIRTCNPPDARHRTYHWATMQSNVMN